MDNLRKYGPAPYSIAVVHGGPGAPGAMASVARTLATTRGVLEPLQTAASVTGQVNELRDILRQNASLPAILIGWSWGAWLSFILAAEYPFMVRKLILISSGPFREEDAASIMPTRLSRLSQDERNEAESLVAALAETSGSEHPEILARFGELMGCADAYDPLPSEDPVLPPMADVYQKVWAEAAELRHQGTLLKLADRIQCPVIAIHGDYDPHPAEGVRGPLAERIEDFRFILLAHCGHHPWLERQAVQTFYAALLHCLE